MVPQSCPMHPALAAALGGQRLPSAHPRPHFPRGASCCSGADVLERCSAQQRGFPWCQAHQKPREPAAKTNCPQPSKAAHAPHLSRAPSANRQLLRLGLSKPRSLQPQLCSPRAWHFYGDTSRNRGRSRGRKHPRGRRGRTAQPTRPPPTLSSAPWIQISGKAASS